MLNIFRRAAPSVRRLAAVPSSVHTANPDLQIRSLLEYPEVRRVMGLDDRVHQDAA